jgi:hypothetical protein
MAPATAGAVLFSVSSFSGFAASGSSPGGAMPRVKTLGISFGCPPSARAEEDNSKARCRFTDVGPSRLHARR